MAINLLFPTSKNAPDSEGGYIWVGEPIPNPTYDSRYDPFSPNYLGNSDPAFKDPKSNDYAGYKSLPKNLDINPTGYKDAYMGDVNDVKFQGQGLGVDDLISNKDWNHDPNPDLVQDKVYRALDQWKYVIDTSKVNYKVSLAYSSGTNLGGVSSGVTYVGANQRANEFVIFFNGALYGASSIEIASFVNTADLSLGTWGGWTAMHEFGHVFGLLHTDPGKNDDQRFSIMAYPTGFYGYSRKIPLTPGMDDIAALQAPGKYGESHAQDRNTTYTFGQGSVDLGHGNLLADVSGANLKNYVMTIWDRPTTDPVTGKDDTAGGIDTIDASSLDTKTYIDLRAGHFSAIGTDINTPLADGDNGSTDYNVGIAKNAEIENAKGGGVDDYIRGNDLRNELEGNGGNDTLEGGKGNDLLKGGSNNDTYIFDGNYGIDTIEDGDGSDTIKINGQILSSGDYKFKNIYKDSSGLQYIKVNGEADLLIQKENDPNLIIIKNWSTGGLGLNLSGSAPTPTGNVMNGDFKKKIDDKGTPEESDDTFIFTDTITDDDPKNYVPDNGANEPGALDLITGTVGNDAIYGKGGSDALNGRGGDDHIDGGSAGDFIQGGLGADTLIGGTGDDVIYGSSDLELDKPTNANHEPPVNTYDNPQGSGFNWVSGYNNGDVVFVGSDVPSGSSDFPRNRIDSKDEGNRIEGNEGNDFIGAGTGADYVDGGADKDLIFGMDKADILFGGAGNDVIFGDGDRPTDSNNTSVIWTLADDHGNDIIDAGAGNDFLFGQGGNDIIFGGADNDKIWGDDPVYYIDLEGNDLLFGGAGNDTISGGRGNDFLEGGEGADQLFGDNGSDTLIGGDGADTLIGGEGADTIYVKAKDGDKLDGLQQNEDKIYYDISLDEIDEIIADPIPGSPKVELKLTNGVTSEIGIGLLGESNYTITLSDGSTILHSELIGTKLNTVVNIASLDNNFIFGGKLNDDLEAIGTNDATLFGGMGDDALQGNTGKNSLNGGAGLDSMNGGAGDDLLNGGDGNDLMQGGIGDDTLEGGGGDDTYYIELNTDTIVESASAGNDSIIILQETQELTYTLGGYYTVNEHFENASLEYLNFSYNLRGNATHNRLTGSESQNRMEGLEGNDTLIGLGGDDSLSGGGGNDVLDGGRGGDSMYGGLGDDTYLIYGNNFAVENDFIYDFSGVSTIEFKNGITVNDLSLSTQFNSGLKINYQTQNSPFLNSVELNVSSINSVGNIKFDNNISMSLQALIDLKVQKLNLVGSLNSDTLYGGYNNDTLSGGDENDYLYGNAGQDLLIGGNGNDQLYGQNENDELLGGNGADWLFGGNGQDTLDGGVGDDILNGEQGSDTYLFGRGYGIDTINDTFGNIGNGETWLNTIQLGANITESDILLTADANNLQINIIGTTDKLIVNYFFNGDETVPFAFDSIRFANQNVWNFQEIRTRLLTGTNGPDTIIGRPTNDVINGFDDNDDLKGQAGNDTLLGGLGNDTLDGGVGSDDLQGQDGQDTLFGGLDDDILDGGAGNDYLRGDAGNDTYKFNLGSGNDFLIDSGTDSADSILFGENITQEDLVIWRSEGNRLSINVRETQDWLVIADTNESRGIELFKFADGSVLDNTAILNQSMVLNTLPNQNHQVYLGSSEPEQINRNSGSIVYGLGGNDTINGSAYDDYIEGGTGDDYLTGGEGNDIFYFKLGDGKDFIDNLSASVSDIDQLRFDSSISKTNVRVTRDFSNLILSVNGTSDGVTLSSWLTETNTRLDQVTFSDGTIWGVNELLNRIVVTPSTELNDEIWGTNYSDVIFAMAGDDSIFGESGDDLIRGEDGTDYINGGSGADYLNGGTGNDGLNGGADNDTLQGGNGDDAYEIYLGEGSDIIDNVADDNATAIDVISTDYNPNTVIVSRIGNDVLVRANALDSFTIKNYFSSVETNNKIDQIYFYNPQTNVEVIWTQQDIEQRVAKNPTNGNDTLYGRFDFDDIIDALAGNDLVYGNDGNDRLTGGTGNDTLVGGKDNDTLIGGAGSDTYIIGQSEAVTTQSYFIGIDRIVDSTTNTNDVDTIKVGFVNLPNWGEYLGDGSYYTLSLNIERQLTNNGQDNLSIKAIGTENTDAPLSNLEFFESFIIENQFRPNNKIENILFSNTTVAESIDNYLARVGYVFIGSDNNDTMRADSAVGATNILGGLGNDFILGNGNANTFLGGAGNDILQGLAEVDYLSGEQGNNLLDGGQHNDWIFGGSGNELLIGGTGNDGLVTGTGRDIILFNKGDGQDIVHASDDNDKNTLSIGRLGVFNYSDMSLNKSGNDLILKLNANNDQITFKSYLSGINNRSIVNLQIIADSITGFVQSSDTSSNIVNNDYSKLRNNKVENFDFANLVSRYVADGSQNNWRLTEERLAIHLKEGSNSAAIGGDLAYQYGRNGYLSNISLIAAQNIINATNFGHTAQTLNATSTWTESVKLA